MQFMIGSFNLAPFAAFAIYLAIATGLHAIFTRADKSYNQDAVAKSEGKNFQIGIEGLRGILAFLVIFAHFLDARYTTHDLRASMDPALFPIAEKTGTIGIIAVAFFFMITGYLFWNKFCIGRQDKDIEGFYLNRLVRIAPMLLVSYVIAAVTIVLCDFHALQNLATGKGFSSFLSMFSVGGYLIDFSKFSAIVVGPTWTLKYEFLFYALLPFLFYTRNLIGRIGYTLFVCFLIAYWDMEPHTIQQWLPNNSFLYIWLGTIVAEIGFALPKTGKAAKYIDITLNIASPIIFIWLIGSERFTFRPMQAWPFMIVMIAFIRGATFGGLLKQKVFLFLGKISYSTYIIHGCVLALVSVITAKLASHHPNSLTEITVGAYILTCILTITASAIGYRYVESPWMGKKGVQKLKALSQRLSQKLGRAF